MKAVGSVRKAKSGGHGDSIIELEDVWKVYRMDEVEVPALRGLTLKVRRGEFLAVRGPSGSGKSTALNMIGCLDLPTKGRVFLEGQDISKLHESDLAQVRGRKIGFIFQIFNLIPTLTAIENVTLPMTFQGKSGEERTKRGEELLRLVGMENRRNHHPAELSGGERQRIAIARSLANDPDVILADEPTGNLDSKRGAEILDFLRKLNREKGKTMIMVTHDENIAKYADRQVHIADGKIEDAGKRAA